jgi:hypothetical protein
MFNDDEYDGMDSDDEENYHTSWSSEHQMSVIEHENRVSEDALF